MRRHACISTLALLAAAGTANADLCLTFGSSTDLFRGRVTGAAPGGFFGLALIEETFDRATFGSIAVATGRVNLALTKNTSTATVAYACQIDPDQLSGQCQIQVFSSSPLSGSRMDDVGFLELACVAPDQGTQGSALPPPGEQE